MLTLHTLNDQICPHRNNAAHATEVPANARLLFCNGQVGSRLDGSVPESTEEQVKIIFERIGIILKSAGMDFSDIVKVSIFVTDAEIIDDYSKVRGAFMGDHNPPATLLVVSPFPRLGVKVEIEAVAAKSED